MLVGGSRRMARPLIRCRPVAQQCVCPCRAAGETREFDGHDACSRRRPRGPPSHQSRPESHEELCGQEQRGSSIGSDERNPRPQRLRHSDGRRGLRRQRLWPSGLPTCAASASSSSTSARTSAATPTTATTTPASSSTPTARTSSTPTRPTSSSTCRRFTEWRPYQHRVLASVDGQQVPMPINLDTVNSLYGLKPDLVRDGGLARVGGREARPDRDLRGRRRLQGRPRPLQQVLPRLHAQAVGARPVRARRQRDRAGADPHQPRRPLLRRHLPGDAADTATRACSRRCSRHPNIKIMLNTDYREIVDLRAVEAHGLHRPDRRVLQLPARQAALPEPRVPARATCRRSSSSRSARSTTRTTTPTRGSASSSTSPGRGTRARRSSTSTRRPRAIRTTRCRGPRTPRSTSATRPTPSR